MRSRISTSAIDLLIVTLATAALTAVVTSERYSHALAASAYYTVDGVNESATLAERFGPRHYSRNAEEWIIRDFFNDRRGGTFLDVGANDYRRDSNTYYLEKELGWSGIAIDAQPAFADGYRLNRPKTRFVALFAADTAGESVRFFVPSDNSLVASASQQFTVRQGAPGTARQVPTTTLNMVLEQAGIATIDFMSMDIELSEPKALAGFDIRRYHPALVCIESHQEVRQQILDYFTRRSYVVVAKYLRADSQNLYFAPLN